MILSNAKLGTNFHVGILPMLAEGHAARQQELEGSEIRGSGKLFFSTSTGKTALAEVA